jgi:5'-3' exonuclease
LHWVLNYYHNGCMSWDWYFPHLYSPLATDMVNLSEFYDEFDTHDDSEFKSWPFEKGTPFPSLAQLLSVLPPQSAELLPKALAELMLHPSSPLIPFYPSDFTSDPNGKRQSWEAVAQIPFIEAEILLDTVRQVLDKDKEGGLLSPAERRRNAPGKSHRFVPKGSGESVKPKTNGATKSKGSRSSKPMAKGASRNSTERPREQSSPKGRKR